MKIIVIGGVPRSLVNFRGPLLQAMVSRGHEVIACAPDAPGDTRKKLADMGVEYCHVPIKRAGMNPAGDLVTAFYLFRLLRQVLYKYVPQEIMDRPKQGFGMPIEQWLQGPLREWAEELLCEKRLREEGFFDPSPIQKMWQEYVKGKGRWHYHLWDVLMFQSWLDENKIP